MSETLDYVLLWWLLRHVHPVLTIVVSAVVWVAAVLLLRNLQGE